jgi:long-chain acyl-CoA synthetase
MVRPLPWEGTYVREYSTPLDRDVPAQGSLTDDVIHNAEHHPDVVSFSRRVGDRWEPVKVRAMAKGLTAAGIESGDRVGLLGRTRYEWTLLDYAIWYAGAVTVPVYETSSPAQVRWILENSGAKALILETPHHVERFVEATDSPALEHTWVLDEGAVDLLTRLGLIVDDDDLDRRRADVGPESVATVIYTSGTTGLPKGCTLTHGNFMFELAVALDALDEVFSTEGSSTLLFLPLAHVFARVIQIGCVRARVRLGHSADIKTLVADLGEFRPTFVLAVPRVFEKLFNTASQNARIDGKGAIFDRAADTAIAYSRARDDGRPGPFLRARHALFDRLVYGKIRAALGGACTYAVSGGAPLGERLGHFYRGIGVTVLEGYGLTETAAAVTVNRPDAVRLGTVGQPLPGTAVRVEADGELVVRGGQVMRGYWENPDATAEVLDEDGWLHTGDLGDIDDEGFVRITGRKKEILVTAGGKNVAPAPLEDRIRAHYLVSQCLVVGDGRPYIAALVTLDADAAARWADEHAKSPDLAVLAEDPELRAAVQTAIDEANASVSQAESIRRFVILDRDWSEESGELTPSLKVRRNVVLKSARDHVDLLYKA